ncbi:hypothetical protein CPB85DRAFT_1314630 [Mucidula mucida]|nr:hypothetical protein CPB85DRAFT_1314630 [Mucidula mucida]
MGRDRGRHRHWQIGSYTLPAGSGGIKHYQGGFVEWYPWNGPGRNESLRAASRTRRPSSVIHAPLRRDAEPV